MSSSCDLDHSWVRRWHRWQGRETGISCGRLLRHPIQSSHEAAPLAWTKLIQTLRQIGPIYYPSWFDHFRYASGVLCYILLCTDCAVSRLVDGWICHGIHDGTSLFACT